MDSTHLLQEMELCEVHQSNSKHKALIYKTQTGGIIPQNFNNPVLQNTSPTLLNKNEKKVILVIRRENQNGNHIG